MQSSIGMKHGLLMMLGAGVVALDYLVYRVYQRDPANRNIRISLREPPSC